MTLALASPALNIPAWREIEYSPSSAIGGNYAPYLARYAHDSALAHASSSARRNLRYSDAPRCLLDYFPAPATACDAKPGQPPGLLVFIHGGYWQELSKDESAFLAPAWQAAGFAHAVIGYSLAPQATLRQIVAQCVAAIGWLQTHAAELGFDASRIVVAGSSAGAYLTAACARACEKAFAGMVLISGIYDLTPLLDTSINTALGLKPEDLPLLNLAAADLVTTRALVTWGEIETAEFKRQSRELAHGIATSGGRCVSFEIQGRNHFDVVHELGDPSAALFEAALDSFSPP